MVRLVRHCQAKGTETDRPNLNYYANSLLYPIIFLLILNINFFIQSYGSVEPELHNSIFYLSIIFGN